MRDESFDRVLSHPPTLPFRHKLRPSLTLTLPPVTIDQRARVRVYVCVHVRVCVNVCALGATPFSVSTSSPRRHYARTSPLVINTFARIPEPFCPGRTFAAAKSLPLHTVPSPLSLSPDPCSQPHTLWFLSSAPPTPSTALQSFRFRRARTCTYIEAVLSRSFSLHRPFDNPTRTTAHPLSSLSPGFCEEPPPLRATPPAKRARAHTSDRADVALYVPLYSQREWIYVYIYILYTRARMV